jgi:hypothetical protein
MAMVMCSRAASESRCLAAASGSGGSIRTSSRRLFFFAFERVYISELKKGDPQGGCTN